MKRYITYFIIAIATVLMATSCEKDVMNFHSSKEGGFSLDLIKNPVEVAQIAGIIPFPYHDPNGEIVIEKDDGSKVTNKLTIAGEESLDFVLDGAVPLLQELFTPLNPGTLDEVTGRYYHDHTFQMIVSSPNGKKTVDLKLRVYKPQDDNTSSSN